METKEIITKYGLIIIVALMILTLFLPIALYIRESSDRIIIMWWYGYTRIQAGVTTTGTYLDLDFTKRPILIINYLLFFISVIASSSLLIISCFTRSKARLSKILVFSGYLLLVLSFILNIYLAAVTSGNIIPVISDPSDPTKTIIIPHIAYYIGIPTLVFGGIIIKMTDWEVA